jgi:hypothetical protein
MRPPTWAKIIPELLYTAKKRHSTFELTLPGGNTNPGAALASMFTVCVPLFCQIHSL